MAQAMVRPRRTEAPARVLLVGGRGHGRHHLLRIRELERTGAVQLVGICDPVPLTAGELAGPGEPEQSPDLAGLLDRTGAGVAVIATPIHTHAPLAVTAAGRGAHVLLEKPPAPSVAEFGRIAAATRAAGTHCQVGFQSLGSHALPAIRELIADGAIGEVTGIGAGGTWVRDTAYFARADWAGRRRLDGADVVDGALTNPLAHSAATALAIDGSDRAEDVTGVEVELFRAHDIESDDTSCARVTTARGTTITLAVTLCAERHEAPYIVVHGDRGRITFWYASDRVLLRRAGHDPEERVYDRTCLLTNLLDALDGTERLLAPLTATGGFTEVVEAVRTAPEPAVLPPEFWRAAAGDSGERRIVSGIDDLVTVAAEKLALYSELGAEWAGRAGAGRPG